MFLKLKDVPKHFGVRPLRKGQKAKSRATCGTCGLSWDDGKSTSWTPAPSGRCPFEYFHKPDAEPRYTYEPGRTIARDGVPCIFIGRCLLDKHGAYGCAPTEADRLTRRIVEFLNQGVLS